MYDDCFVVYKILQIYYAQYKEAQKFSASKQLLSCVYDIKMQMDSKEDLFAFI